MKPRIAAVLVLTLLCIWVAAAAQSERSVWDGVYTDDQATRGKNTFAGNCTRCHAAEDFTGSTFLSGWEGSTVQDLFKQMITTMPMDNPGSLRPEDYIDVISYFLKVNAMPPGKDELDTDPEHLKLIRITAKK